MGPPPGARVPQGAQRAASPRRPAPRPGPALGGAGLALPRAPLAAAAAAATPQGALAPRLPPQDLAAGRAHGFRQKVAISPRSCRLPATLACPSLPPSLPPASSRSLPVPSTYSRSSQRAQPPPPTFSPRPQPPASEDGVWVSGETKLSAQHPFRPLLLNWPERTKGGGLRTRRPQLPRQPPALPSRILHPRGGGAGDRPRPGLSSLPALRGRHRQVSRGCNSAFPCSRGATMAKSFGAAA